MTDEPDIIRQLRKEEKLGLLHSKTGSTHELKFAKQSHGEIPDSNHVFIEPGAADGTLDDTLCNILLDDLYKAAFELSPDCIIILDLHGVVQSCNTRTVAKLGWQKEEIIGKHISEIDVFRTDDASERLKSFSAVLGERDIEPFETEIVCRDGSSFFAEVCLILLKKDGEKIGVLVIWRDITKNTKINQTLHRYEKIIKTVKHPMSLINTNYVYQTINDAYLLFVNKSREEIEGHPSEEVLGKEFFEKQIKPYFDKCLAGEEVRYQVSFNIPRKETRILEIEAYPYFDSGGAISGVVTNTIDITDQRKKEEIIVQSEKKYRELANSLPQVVYETDEHANITFVSQASLSLTGYTEEDFKGLNVLQTVAPIDRAKLKNNILKLLQGETIAGNEYLMQRKDGSTFPALFHSTPILHDNKIVGLRGFAVDITEQKQIERALRESEVRFRELFNRMSSGVAVYEAIDNGGDFIFRDFNPAAEMIEKVSRKDILGKRVSEAFPGVKASGVFEVFQRVWQTGKPEYYPENIYKDEKNPGSWRENWVFKLPTGEIVYIYNDVTERKLAERTLKESEEKLRSIIENSSDQIFMLDKDCKFLSANKTAADLFRKSPQEMIGRSIFEIFPETITAQFSKNIKNVFDTGKSLSIDEKMIIQGREFYNSTSLNSINDSSGRVIAVTGIVRDITERKRMEERLRETEERFRIAAETSNDAVYEWDMQHSIQWFGKIDEMLGYGRGEFPRTFDAWTDLVHPEDKKRVAAAVQAHLDGRMPYAIEYRVRTKDGTCRWWTARGAVTRTPDGHPIRWIGTVTDITEHKKAEKEVIESEEKLRKILDSSPDAITVTDLNGNITECNQATTMMHGFNKKELIGKNASELFSSKDLERAKESLKKTLESESVKNLECTLLTKDGRKFPAELSASLIRDASGNPLSFVAITKDITERKRAEETLRDSEERFRTIFDSAIDGILIADIENKNFFICNKAICDMLGYSEEEIKNLGVMEIHPKEDLSFVVEQFNKLARREIVLVKGIPMKRKDGSVFYADISSTPIIIGGKTYLMGSFRDITERKKIEEEIRKMHELLQIVNKDLERKVTDRTAEIHSLLKQKDEFINQLGHDLKNPLTPITTLLPILKKQVSDAESLEYFDVVIRNVEYMKNLVTKTLELAQLNSPNTILDIENINLAEKINDTVSTQKIMFQTKHITVENKIQETIIVQADTLRLEELLKNLLTNAVKYTPEGGCITLDAKPEKDSITVSVQDTGIGLTKEQIAYIFDEFYKVDQSRHDFDSSGLGLPICRRIAEKHGGKIWVESEGLGKGCTVYFTIKTGRKGSMDN